MTPAIEVVDLVKRYPKRPSNAVDGLSFTVEPGEIFGLLGPNGAGKTSTVGILTTLVVLTSGTARLHGVDVAADPVGARRLLAMVPQRNNLDRSLTARQNLVFHAAYHGVPASQRNTRADELLEQFGLAGRGGDKVIRYSGGQVQRLMIARALMHRPEVLFLDEPSTGLDPQARLFVWDRIRELRSAGVTILLTTHDMDEAAELSDRVGIMDHGRLLAMDTPTALTRALPGDSTLELTVTVPDSAEDAEDAEGESEGEGTGSADMLAGLAELDGVQKAEQVRAERSAGTGNRPAQLDLSIRLYLTVDGPELVGPASAVVAKHGGRVIDVAMGRSSLEDVFFSLTGRGLR